MRRGTMRPLLLCLCTLSASSQLLLRGLHSEEMVATHSFSPPFAEIDSAGTRKVSDHWEVHGAAVANSNFVRLTPDRQSKRGALWSKAVLNVEEVSATLKFRISGQGKKFFGDGLALWFVTDPTAYGGGGELHGMSETFSGFGIIFDTFKNVETLSYHRDVTVLHNDGTRSVDEMQKAVEGCDGELRYHEDRGDFSVDSASRAKIIIDTVKGENEGDPPRSRLGIMIDAKNDHNWVECVNMELPMPPSWVKNARVGITASTGQLADNHDVLSLQIFHDAVKHNEYEVAALAHSHFEKGDGVTEDRFDKIESMVGQLLSRLDYLEHHLEHEMVAADDHVKTTVSKLREQEAAAEKKIDALESGLLGSAEESMLHRVSILEDMVAGTVKSKVKEVKKTIDQNITGSVEATVRAAGRGWRWPFVLLIVGDIVVGYAAWKWYTKFKKTHLL